ncbi:disease resistance protein RUN1-like [Carya illinoinensis]|uniref:disease resistance protein RUN1-like n=1 Tax=Carya illinoinensis TaxID=32201 RepID=UPI001C7186BC|nr:disease resistance protein RUN1-like [Carya illinoinensis]
MWNLLRRKSDDVRFVGICGMGGIGKTTLAEVVSNRIRNQFQAHSFIGFVREESTGYHGLVSLQKQLLSQILKEEKLNIQDVHGGMNMIKNILFSRKVLIVLDNVDKEQQLEALAGNHDWFGPGNRINVTTFKKPYPKENYVDLCKEIVKYANGLPLALKVLDKFLLIVCVGSSFSMHDLLHGMGKEIVQRESPEEPS